MTIETASIRALPDGRVTRAQAAEFLGYKPKTLAEWQRLDKGPPVRKVGGRCFYMIDDLRAFVTGEKIAA